MIDLVQQILQIMQLTGTVWTKNELQYEALFGIRELVAATEKVCDCVLSQGSGQESREFGIESGKE